MRSAVRSPLRRRAVEVLAVMSGAAGTDPNPKAN
jgi:hypothetical protein